MNALEEGGKLNLNFRKIAETAGVCRDVLPVAVQNVETGEVILVAYTNETAFKRTVETRRLVLWSTSRNKLWEKGKESGNTFDLVEAYVNCEQNSLLYKVRPRKGAICHTNNKKGRPRNCFYRRIDLDAFELENTDP